MNCRAPAGVPCLLLQLATQGGQRRRRPPVAVHRRVVQRRRAAFQRRQEVHRVEDLLGAAVAPRVLGDDLAAGHHDDPVDVALDRHRPERPGPRHAVAVGVEAPPSGTCRRRPGCSTQGSNARRGSRAAAATSSAKRSPMTNAPEADRTVRRRSSRHRVPHVFVQLGEAGDARHGRGEPPLHGRARRSRRRASRGPAPAGRTWARRCSGWPGRRSGGGGGARRPRRIVVATVLGLSHQTSRGTAAKNSKARTMPCEDGLGALGRQGDGERGVGVGPDGHQDGDLAAAVGEVDVDVPEVGLQAAGPAGGPAG